MLTRKEYLLQLLQEECVEVAERASKAVRFGLEEVPSLEHLPSNIRQCNNAELIMHEVNDLLGILTIMWAEGLLPPVDQKALEVKKLRVEKYMDYSRKLGILEPHDHGTHH